MKRSASTHSRKTPDTRAVEEILLRLVRRWRVRPLTLYTQILTETDRVCVLKNLAEYLKTTSQTVREGERVTLTGRGGDKASVRNEPYDLYMLQKLAVFVNMAVQQQSYLLQRFS